MKKLLARQWRVKMILLFLVSVIFYTLNLQGWQWYQMVEQTTCETPKEYMEELKSLIKDTHEILDEAKLTHILIYGSLYGALRIGAPLPWDNDFDIGLLTEEVHKINEKSLLQAFKKKNIDIYYRHWKGEYVVSRNEAHGDLMLFSRTFFGDRGRTGIEPWLFFVHFRRFHQAPARLFEKPLPTLPFLGLNISVPREGLEIQKHFYPSDWWKEIKPKGC